MTKKIDVNYTQFNKLLRANVVTVYDLCQFFKKDDIDYDEFGNIFIGFNDNTSGLPILVAHTDNVLGENKEPVFDLSKRYIKGMRNGIGFDDKAGIMAIITLWQHYKTQKFRVIFPANEEVGGVGSQNMDESRYCDAKWILELDRKDKNHFIQRSGGTRLCSDEFAQKFLDLGFKKEEGIFTDVNIFKERADWVNMANISIGYFEPHTDNEYLDTVAFENIINKVAQFIDKDYDFEPDEPDKFDYDFNNTTTIGSKRCANCGCDCSGGAMIYNQFGDRFCSRECMEDYDFEWDKYNKGV